jgi:hypothetical protein
MEPDKAVDDALEVLADGLTLEEAHAGDSHTAIVVSGMDDPQVANALGLYLVGLLAGVVRTNLQLSTALLDTTPEGRQQLAADVQARLEPSVEDSQWTIDHFDTDVRDPWIAEGVGHAILAVRGRAVTPCLGGSVAALSVPHSKPTQQGLDLVAIYDEDGLPAMALGEAKATLDNGSGRLTESIGFFREVEMGSRDLEIRMQVVLLQEALSDTLRRGLSGAFWRNRACFLPLIAHGDDFDIRASRPALLALSRPPTHKRVIHCRPPAYGQFFDGIAAAMQRAVATINP